MDDINISFRLYARVSRTMGNRWLYTKSGLRC